MEFQQRLNSRKNELKSLLDSLYQEGQTYEKLMQIMSTRYQQRDERLKRLDCSREKNPTWYLDKKMLGLTMYTDLFAGNLRGLVAKIPYLQELGITYLHLMPILKMPKTHNDGGYAVDSLCLIDPQFGSNEDLSYLTEKLREVGISLCLDFIMNHTSSTHPKALAVKAGDEKAKEFYTFFPDRTIPDQYDAIVPQVFPATAPGNFTYVDEIGEWVLTSFYPFQWDLNYARPEVLLYVIDSLLSLANLGNEVFRLDAVPYIWKQLGTTCRNLPQVHTIVRIIRLATEVVCPAIILKGEVVMAPKELAAYFGSTEKPECHLLYNAAVMANFWDSLASQNIVLLEEQLSLIFSLPPHAHFVNYLRCHDDIGWALDEERQRAMGQDPLSHKKFVYQFFAGQYPFSYSRGELYNYDAVSQDARSCGTTASFCGLESALALHDTEAMDRAIARILLLHAVMFSVEGFPLLSSGDEIGQLNDYRYHEDPLKRDDQRNVHRSLFDWDKAALRKESGTYQQKIFTGIQKILQIKKQKSCFSSHATVQTWKAHNDKILIIRRVCGNEELLCIASFSDTKEHFYTDCLIGEYQDLFTGALLTPGWGYEINSHAYIWAQKVVPSLSQQ